MQTKAHLLYYFLLVARPSNYKALTDILDNKVSYYNSVLLMQKGRIIFDPWPLGPFTCRRVLLTKTHHINFLFQLIHVLLFLILLFLLLRLPTLLWRRRQLILVTSILQSSRNKARLHILFPRIHQSHLCSGIAVVTKGLQRLLRHPFRNILVSWLGILP